MARAQARTVPCSTGACRRARTGVRSLHRFAWTLGLAAGVGAMGCPRPDPAPPPAEVPTAAPRPPSPTSLESNRRVLFEQSSPYGPVYVVETPTLRCLKFSLEGGDQSCVDRRDPSRIVHEYVRFLSVALLFAPPSPRALMVGLGGGRAVRMLLDHVPQLRLDVVEINPVVIQVARQFFDVEPSERLRIHLADGREFFTGKPEHWDMVVLDAFGSDFIPFHLTTVEFLRTVAEHLSPEGTVAANLWTRNDELFRAMLKTYAAVFPHVFVFRGVRVGNAIVIATRRSKPENCAEVVADAHRLAPSYGFRFSFTEPADQCEPLSVTRLDDVPVLADDQKAAFEALGPL